MNAVVLITIGNLSKDVFERRTVNRKRGLFPCNMPKRYQKCTARCSFSYKEDFPKLWGKLLPTDAKSSLPVDMRRSKTSLLNKINMIN